MNLNSYKDITFKFLLKNDIKTALCNLTPISDEESRGQIMSTLFSYERFSYEKQADFSASTAAELCQDRNVKVFRTIIILYQGECVGTGSVWINSNNEC